MKNVYNFTYLPKVELHLHLEGSITPALLAKLVEKNSTLYSSNSVKKFFSFKNFKEFVESYLFISSFIKTPQDLSMVIRNLASQQKNNNVILSEIHFTIATHVAQKKPIDEFVEVLGEEQKQLEKKGIYFFWIFDIVRGYPLELADKTLELAITNKNKGVVALGLSGFEELGKAKAFKEHFKTAKEYGLATVAHAGEFGPPEAVWEALEFVQPSRIGHGLSIKDYPNLIEEIKKRTIIVECCPTSNLILGAVKRLEEHPIKTFVEKGIEVTLATDDPGMFNISLNKELENVAKILEESSIIEIIEKSFNFSFKKVKK